MKFLLAMSIFVSASAFAEQFVCYSTAQQNGEGEIAFVLEGALIPPTPLQVVFPSNVLGLVTLDLNDCLAVDNTSPLEDLTLCLGTGQEVGGRIPVESTVGANPVETVYCDSSILTLFPEVTKK